MKTRQIFATYQRVTSGPPDTPRFCSACGAECRPKLSGGRWRHACPACGDISYQNPLPGVAILVVDRDHILLCRRTPGRFAGGKWCLPCGFVEFDEDYLTAAIRETREETGLDVNIRSILSVASNFFSEKLHSLVVVLLAERVGGVARGGDDIDQVQWFRFDENLPELAFEADRHIIERYFRTRLNGAPVDPDYAGPTTGFPTRNALARDDKDAPTRSSA
jgi:8-oxo-dGTP diphosphatase